MNRHVGLLRVVRISLFALLAIEFGWFAQRAPADEPSPPAIGQTAAAALAKDAAEADRFFETRVRPILAARCFECHGPKKQEAGLRLDSREALLKGSAENVVVVAGQPDNSLLVEAILHDGDVEMPPAGKLPAEEIEALTAWVKLGLPWPGSTATQALTGDALYRHTRANLWSLQPIRGPQLPAVKNASWSTSPIDPFVLAKLEAAGLTPSDEADRRTLIRRATFDLLGLPPTAEEVAAFENDSAPDAYERLIDRLIASPRYGERWGRHWMDVARYADTRGYNFDRDRRYPYSYTYRDYVVRAHNADLPYDQFVMEQLAADLLPAAANDNRRLAALGFLTVGRRYNNDPDDIDDRIDVVTRGLLGLTVACARCHDHKYDPIPSADYYSLYGVFASCTEPRDLTIIGTPDDRTAFDAYTAELNKRQAELDRFLDGEHAKLLDMMRTRVTEYLVRVVSDKPEALLAKLPYISLSSDELRPKLIERWRRYLKDRGPDDAVFGPWRRLAALEEKDFEANARRIVDEIRGQTRFNVRVVEALAADVPKSKPDIARVYGQLLQHVYQHASEPNPPPGTDELRKALLSDRSPTAIPRGDLREYLDRAQRNKSQEFQKKIDEHNVQSAGAPPRAMMLVDKTTPVEPYVFLRGQADRRGESVPRRFLRVIAGDERKPFVSGSGRLELGRSIVDPANPLTARVLANRVWMHHFAAPLVSTPSDFGLRSDPPSHPELLDYLAWDLRDHGWSIKRLHRLIMLSSAYRQASVERPACAQVDPENRLLWRANRRRLELEAVRDSLLAVAGALDLRVGGRPVDLMARPFTPRRTVYGYVDRQDLPNLFRVFDFASPDQSSDLRPRTTVPQQALFLMNSQFVGEQVRRLTARPEVASAALPDERIAALYRTIYSRPATPDEIQIGREFIGSMDPATAWPRFAQALLLANEFVFVD